MNRADSGFNESFSPETSETKPDSTRNSRTSHTHKRRPSKSTTPPTKSNTNINTDTKPKIMHSTGQATPAISHRNPHRRQSSTIATGPRRKSLASSTSTSSKSPGLGNDSRSPSSRRTSCTVVDPSRPARHYRIKSSNTVPTASMNADVDDVLALHFRSCTLFKTPVYTSNNLVPNTTEKQQHEGAEQHPSLDSGTMIRPASHQDPSTTSAAPSSFDNITPAINVSPEHTSHSEIPSASTENPNPTTTTATTHYFLSPSTRRQEYAKMDRANSGIRILFRKVVPQCVTGPPPPRFFDENKSDVGSVRRYRLDLLEDEGEREKGEEASADLSEAKDIKAAKSQVMVRQQAAAASVKKGKKRWACF